MNKIILATVLLVALSAFAPTIRAEVDVQKFTECFKGDMARLAQVEIPMEIRRAREYLIALGHDPANRDDLQTYKRSMSQEEQENLINAATKYWELGFTTLFEGPCAKYDGYKEWVRAQDLEKSPIMQVHYVERMLLKLAFFIVKAWN